MNYTIEINLVLKNNMKLRKDISRLCPLMSLFYRNLNYYSLITFFNFSSPSIMAPPMMKNIQLKVLRVIAG